MMNLKSRLSEAWKRRRWPFVVAAVAVVAIAVYALAGGDTGEQPAAANLEAPAEVDQGAEAGAASKGN